MNPAATQTLLVLLGGEVIGAVHAEGDQLRFAYDPEYRARARPLPLSVSMPLERIEHGHEVIAPFLWGLLPDNEKVLEQVGRENGVSPRNVFRLLACAGEECAGAVQLVRPERLPAVLDDPAPPINWLDQAGVAERLRDVREHCSTGRRATDPGRFSLAGVQPKVALLYYDDRWGVPSGRVPTTHILKPPMGDLQCFAENEHFCLALARAVGLPAASVRTERFEDELALVVERYDRVVRPGGPGEILRVHQEDLCQALGRTPGQRYQAEGGPSPREIVGLLRAYSTRPGEDVDTFVDALAFNWMVGGTDAHAKNYSVLHGRTGIRLAPLYDIASWLPYGEIRQARMAMKIGSTYEFGRVYAWQWRELAADLAVDEAALFDRLRGLASRIPDEALRVRDELVARGLDASFVARLAGLIAERARACLTELA